jgi:hypothetical protein
MIYYSNDAEPARAYLLKRYNDIDVFVEDSRGQNVYVKLINRLLEGVAKINTVFPLHSRKNVIEECVKDQVDRARKRIYIIDADSDLIRGKPVPALKHLYRLEVYCSENLLLSENALLTLATECDTSCSWPDAALRLRLRPLLEGAVEILFPLFIAYGIVEELGLTIHTVGYSVNRLLDNPSDPNTLSRKLTRVRILGVIREIISKSSIASYSQGRERIMTYLSSGITDKSIFISGKDYLLKIAWMHLKRNAKFTEPFDVLKVRLAQYCELELARGLKQALLKELQ